jgi:prophage antirepressor-like protein
MSEIMKFGFDSSQVRVVKDGGEVWFVASDVAKVLGYRDAANMARMLGEDEKGTHILGTLGGNQALTIINESGLYACILKSRRPDAERFRKWVTGEVLPQIRKQGFYADTDQRLTKRTSEEIAHGLMALANEVRRSLPKFTSKASLVTNACIFIQRSAGQRASLDGTRDEVAYHKAMDKRGLPGITVDESTPISVTFDWHASHQVDERIVARLYALLEPHCRAYRSAMPGIKPFSDQSNCCGLETITGFRSATDARELAATLAQVSREFLVSQALAA